jgi:hypothetical protein
MDAANAQKLAIAESALESAQHKISERNSANSSIFLELNGTGNASGKFNAATSSTFLEWNGTGNASGKFNAANSSTFPEWNAETEENFVGATENFRTARIFRLCKFLF